MPVSMFRRVALAPRTTAPLVSVTTPLSAAVESCARADVAKTEIKPNHSRTLKNHLGESFMCPLRHSETGLCLVPHSNAGHSSSKVLALVKIFKRFYL